MLGGCSAIIKVLVGADRSWLSLCNEGCVWKTPARAIQGLHNQRKVPYRPGQKHKHFGQSVSCLNGETHVVTD